MTERSTIKSEAGEELDSEKTREIITKQKPIEIDTVKRVKKSLADKGYVLEQSAEWDRYLETTGKEAITMSDGTIILHTLASASGFFEELIHYGQIRSGRAIYGDLENTLLMEIEAKERLIRSRNAYRITDYEIELLTESLSTYKMELEKLRKGGV